MTTIWAFPIKRIFTWQINLKELISAKQVRLQANEPQLQIIHHLRITCLCLDKIEEDEVCFEESGSAEDNEFDAVVGALEEILLGEAFQKVQKGFCDEHCGM